MFIIKKKVYVSDTDCTQALYFTTLLRFVQEAFEDVLREKYTKVAGLFVEGKLLMPIVATSAEFLAPIYIGSLLDIHLDVKWFNTSFEVKGEVFHEGLLKGKVSISHVCMDTVSKKGLKSKELFHDL